MTQIGEAYVTGTSTQAEELQKCHALVWRYRGEMAEYWPTPPRTHALEFAVSEIGEAFDARMRTHPDYARNNARDVDELDEWADTAMMLLTALGPEWTDAHSFAADRAASYGLPLIGRDIFEALRINEMHTKDYTTLGRTRLVDRHIMDALWGISTIAGLQGEGLRARLAQRLERIKAKQMRTIAA